jgi:hypothetical protein
MTVIESDIKPTHRPVPAGPIEAWQYTGQPYDQWPDWVRSKIESVYQGPGNIPRPRKGDYALRDDEGYFWKWMREEKFEYHFEPLTPRS